VRRKAGFNTAAGAKFGGCTIDFRLARLRTFSGGDGV